MHGSQRNPHCCFRYKESQEEGNIGHSLAYLLQDSGAEWRSVRSPVPIEDSTEMKVWREKSGERVNWRWRRIRRIGREREKEEKRREEKEGGWCCLCWLLQLCN